MRVHFLPAVTAMVSFIFFAGPVGAAEPVDYLRDIKPVLQTRCFACHGALKQQSGLRLDSGHHIRKGGDSGPAVVAHDSADSPLLQRISAGDASVRMPPEGMPLTPAQIEFFRAWIDQGAITPADDKAEEDPRHHWAFRKPVRVGIPQTATPRGNPIDAFLAAKHSQQGLTSRPLVEKSVLLRRVYLDLIGVPPTVAELDAFLADESAGAYESVVDRLLADPRYGERWARHWMDVWRYSDWYGRRHVPDVWNSAPQIWRWRDWIVRSLNADHGYDRMVREMLAADEICPDDPEASVATGYLIRNWYALNPNDWMRSTVEHTGKAFLGLTFNCAHCHDHKYDPIEQDDYFRLRAFFEPMNVRQDRVPGEADPGPFQEYNYSALRKIQRLGAVRIFDSTPDAPTWFYTGGDERNRVKDRGSLSPGVPTFLASVPLKLEPITLPARSWYPGLHPDIQATVLDECREEIRSAEAEISQASKEGEEVPAALSKQLAEAEAAYQTAANKAQEAGSPRALEGRQSLFLDATTGRRTVQNGLRDLKKLENGATLRFQLQVLSDAHINFQLAKDVVQGLTAGYVAFDHGKILAYKPNSFHEFEVGCYDFAGGENRFQVSLVIQTALDQCLLSVRTVPGEKVLVDNVPVALNGWNPVGDPTKAILFDARTGSRAFVDSLVLSPTTSEQRAGEAVAFDFEPPTYRSGRDVAGIDGWSASQLSVAPATSIVLMVAADNSLTEWAAKLEAARQAIEVPSLHRKAAKAKLLAAQAALKGTEARIAADRAKYGESPTADAVALARSASQLEREAAECQANATLLASEYLLAVATAKPTSDVNRTKEMNAVSQQLNTAQRSLSKARKALTDASQAEKYSPLSPQYPRTSTGRRKALAQWITHRDNPLTARVAVNHLWSRHFHAPLVTTVYDFGRSSASPTHPELLDWLSVELIDSGWSMKHLHRLVVTSEAYRRVTSMGNATQEATIDPENKLLWRMNTGRMEAEVLRDSLLALAGELDCTMGGQELENGEAFTTRRRSLYYSVYPEQGGKSELGELFDGPDALECYRRTRSIVPQQALVLTNSDWIHKLTRAIADELWKEASAADMPPESATHRFIVVSFRRILTRMPSQAEIDACSRFLAQGVQRADQTDPPRTDSHARESLVRVILNHNDFVTIR